MRAKGEKVVCERQRPFEKPRWKETETEKRPIDEDKEAVFVKSGRKVEKTRKSEFKDVQGYSELGTPYGPCERGHARHFLFSPSFAPSFPCILARIPPIPFLTGLASWPAVLS